MKFTDLPKKWQNEVLRDIFAGMCDGCDGCDNLKTGRYNRPECKDGAKDIANEHTYIIYEDIKGAQHIAYDFEKSDLDEDIIIIKE